MEIKIKTPEQRSADLLWEALQENARFRKALENYANIHNYRRNLTDTGVSLVSRIHKDGGKIARAALQNEEWGNLE